MIEHCLLDVCLFVCSFVRLFTCSLFVCLLCKAFKSSFPCLHPKLSLLLPSFLSLLVFEFFRFACRVCAGDANLTFSGAQTNKHKPVSNEQENTKSQEPRERESVCVCVKLKGGEREREATKENPQKKKIELERKFDTPGGTRTRNLWLRRPTRCHCATGATVTCRSPIQCT